MASVVVLMVLAAACESASWPTLGFGAARTGQNPFESTVGVGNVAQLAKVWSSTALPGGPQGSSPVVAAGRVRDALDAARAALEIAEGGLLPGLEAGWIEKGGRRAPGVVEMPAAAPGPALA